AVAPGCELRPALRARLRMIRVLIAEDETLVRSGIRTLLERQAEIAIVAEAVDGQEALAALRSGVDVGLLDVRMPRLGGIRVLQSMRGWAGSPPRLLPSTFDDAEALLAGVRAGGRGYLRKDVSVENLVWAIRVLAEGGTFFQPSLTEKLLRGLHGVSPPGCGERPVMVESLTAREQEVMRL